MSPVYFKELSQKKKKKASLLHLPSYLQFPVHFHPYQRLKSLSGITSLQPEAPPFIISCSTDLQTISSLGFVLFFFFNLYFSFILEGKYQWIFLFWVVYLLALQRYFHLLPDSTVTDEKSARF